MAIYVKPLSILALLVLLAFTTPADAQSTPKLSVTSSAFAAGATIPVGYTCNSPTVESPPLAWKGVPDDTKTLVLILEDPDAPHGTFFHWVVYNLPATLHGLDANVPPSERLPNGGLQGVNSLGQIGYKGPCPPRGSAPHHYHFDLTALDTVLDLKPGATAAQVEEAAQGHVKATGDLVGTFAR
ncbi:MAG TPA: YbhB/YbcL family Raf kinase inhibitor-like protein [Candidatus Binataceae bacterium]|nr:YbhB/YbcL family Raf kinase inhibitor-like protein [Candidatus Binataceae bacterium]